MLGQTHGDVVVYVNVCYTLGDEALASNAPLQERFLQNTARQVGKDDDLRNWTGAPPFRRDPARRLAQTTRASMADLAELEACLWRLRM